ncbi:MAG: LytTR family transcriptional regulator [Bacteroidetes bacterium]|nr:LytTR family transcriptional regulator [Bacteroidota bacterium]
MDFLRYIIARYRTPILASLVVLGILIVFEACQQYFYIRQYNLVPREEISFARIIFGQLYRWLIWAVITGSYFGLMIYLGKIRLVINSSRPLIYFGQIIGLIFINLSIISLVQLWLNQDSLSGYAEYLTFYFFQKTPVYLLAYLAVMACIHLMKENQFLSLEIEGLEKKAASQKSFFQSLRQSIPHNGFLNVKIGRKNKRISVDEIYWIEADDYCVKIHTDHGRTYAMRSSMKKLSEELSVSHFLRIHRKALVNMNKVKEINLGDEPVVILNNSQEIEVAKTRLKELREYLKREKQGYL